MEMHTNPLTALVSLAGLLTGASLAVVGALHNADSLVNVGSTIIGGALGMFVPQPRGATQTRRPTSPKILVDSSGK
jgi:hypothetical protein